MSDMSAGHRLTLWFVERTMLFNVLMVLSAIVVVLYFLVEIPDIVVIISIAPIFVYFVFLTIYLFVTGPRA